MHLKKLKLYKGQKDSKTIRIFNLQFKILRDSCIENLIIFTKTKHFFVAVPLQLFEMFMFSCLIPIFDPSLMFLYIGLVIIFRQLFHY